MRRLAPAVWICAPVTAPVLLAVGLSWPTDAVTRLVRTALFAPYSPWVDSVYWTLGIEIAFYSVVWTLLWLGRFHLMEVVAIAIGLISTLFWCLYYPLDWSEFAETRWLALLLVHHGCFFATGVMIWLMRFKAVTPFRLVLCALFLAGCVLQIASSVDVHTVGRRADAIRATDRLLPGCHSPDGMVLAARPVLARLVPDWPDDLSSI
ncbi:hypothetical protein [Mesorhizobium sp.]|uniref:hypothetical protein n=1 Tax=Mesorhizobium sp. TaxID=1871066 RepID=UPI00257BB2B9|nr:hypothetical protein [Mesorhizobium sp.]